MYNRSKPFVVALLLCIFVVALVPRPTEGKDYIIAVAAWENWHETENQQGIQRIGLHFTNQTTYDYAGWFYPYTDFTDMDHEDWFFNTSLLLQVVTTLNMSYMGLSDPDDGINLIRHNVTVTILDTIVFSKSNLTYWTNVESAGIAYYYHNTTISCFNYPAIYKVVITYEILY